MLLSQALVMTLSAYSAAQTQLSVDVNAAQTPFKVNVQLVNVRIHCPGFPRSPRR
jgi:hypothetical protein